MPRVREFDCPCRSGGADTAAGPQSARPGHRAQDWPDVPLARRGDAAAAGHTQSRSRAAIRSTREHERRLSQARRHAPARGQRCASPRPRRSGVVIGHAGFPPLPRLRESPQCLLAPDPWRLASVPGCFLRGGAATSVEPRVSAGRDELEWRALNRRSHLLRQVKERCRPPRRRYCCTSRGPSPRRDCLRRKAAAPRRHQHGGGLYRPGGTDTPGRSSLAR
jgi:hypothetical protein